MDECHLFAVTAISIFATFQYTGITTLETEREDVKRYIRACLVDHANDTKRNTYSAEAQTIGQCLLLCDMSEG